MTPTDPLDDDELARLVARAAALPDAPAPLVRAAIDLFPARPQAAPLREAAQAAVRLVVATLAFDSWATAQPAWGVRASASQSRHLLFSARGLDFDLRIAPEAGNFALSGQILGAEGCGSVELATDAPASPDESPALAAPLDALGEFCLQGVRRGTYRMTLHVGGERIVLPAIEVGARTG